jgi:hypothetical protein
MFGKGRKTMVPQHKDKKALKRQTMGQGMAIGMVLFLPAGFILSIAIDNFAFVGIGLPIAVAVGVAIGESLYKRKLEESGNENN